MEELTCKVDRVVFFNEETNFYITKCHHNKKLLTIKGTFPGVSLCPGLKVKFSGMRQECHAKYGEQYLASACDIILENGKRGVTAYFASRVPGVGTITAARLYDEFGDDLPRVLEETPEKLFELEFLNDTRARSILSEWRRSSEVMTTSMFLLGLGLNAYQAKSVYRKFGADAMEIVKDDPYVLDSCESIGFHTADIAARALGIGVDDTRRVRAIVVFILKELAKSDGHMFVTSDHIKSKVGWFMKKHSIMSFSHGDYMSDAIFYPCLVELEKDGVIKIDRNNIYLMHNWISESRSARYIADIIESGPYSFDNLADTLARFEKEHKLALSDEQREAFMMLEGHRICIVSGFPGTGKTLLVSAFTYLFEENNMYYELLSPTGIAAKRLSKVTGKSASTIHRALGYQPDGTWEFCGNNKFRVDAVVLDEASMVSGSVFYHLMDALPKNVIIIIVGDSAQLPSVGAGHILNNLMRSERVPSVFLTHIFRQENKSDIVSVAHAILTDSPIDTGFNDKSEFIFLPFNLDEVVGEICKLTSALKERKANFQVMAPIYDGELGVNNLNTQLREVLNTKRSPDKNAKLNHGSCDLYEGDRIMVVANDYDKMIYNGDVGKVKRISIRDNKVDVIVFDWFDGNRYLNQFFTFSLEEARRLLKVAFACSIHKCQGQEYDYVILPMTTQYRSMLCKNLIYTAITRARKKVFLFGDPVAFMRGVKSNREVNRNSNLIDLIEEYCDVGN